MSIKDQIARKAEELKLQDKVGHLSEAATKALSEAKTKAGHVVHENRDKVDSVLDKAGAEIDKRTNSKYSDKIDKTKERVGKVADKISEQRPDAATAAGVDAQFSGTHPGAHDDTHTEPAQQYEGHHHDHAGHDHAGHDHNGHNHPHQDDDSTSR